MSDNIRHTGEYMNIHQLRKMLGQEEIDYQMLLGALHDYSQPRDKITGWLKSGELIRIKKGLYVFGKEASQTPYSLEVLANLIYGPSAISLSYALSYYGLIPERVDTITSITNKRNKSFTTPAGDFTYQYLTNDKYTVGIEINNNDQKRPFLIASPEKALSDHIHLTDKNILLQSDTDIQHYLFDDLRIDEQRLQTFNTKKFKAITDAYQDARLTLLKDFITEWKKHA